MVFETLGLSSNNPANVLYLFYEIILVFWWRIVLEQQSLQLPDVLMFITVKHD